MKRSIFTSAIVFALMAAGGTAYKHSAAVAGGVESAAVLATMANATRTPAPTATVNYQATAQIAQTQVVIAQGTAIEAARINAQATAQHEQLIRAQVEGTTQADGLQALKIQMTATAAGTSIPLTATAQAMNGTAIANYQAMQAAQMTATHEAPAILRAAKFSEAYNGTVDFWAQTWAFIGLGALGLFVPLVLWVVPRKVEYVSTGLGTPQETSARLLDRRGLDTGEEPKETVIRVQQSGAYPSMSRMVVPCAPKQLTEFATGVLHGKLSLAFANWETKESPFTRDEYILMRNFMLSNKMAQSAGGGSLILTAEGESLLINWLDVQQLPAEYKFDEVKI